MPAGCQEFLAAVRHDTSRHADGQRALGNTWQQGRRSEGPAWGRCLSVHRPHSYTRQVTQRLGQHSYGQMIDEVDGMFASTAQRSPAICS